MLLKQTVVDALNRQVIEEFTASLQYTAIALYFDQETLPELSNFFHIQATEEHEHAMKLLQYINDAGGQSIVPATKAVKNHFESAEEAIQLALDQELTVTDQINNLVDIAIQEKDHLTRQFLQWFVTEQVEEEASASQVLETLKMIGDQSHALLMLDRELGGRGAGEPEEDGE